jgi:glycosyltransferase involved in cell wall biosynthesis
VKSSQKVLHLITELDTGGAQKALARLLARLDRRRFDPRVACLYNGDKVVSQEIRQLDIPVIDLGMTAKWRWDAFWRLYRLLRREHPTILHTWMFHANVPGRLLGRLAGVPIIISSERTMGQESHLRYGLNRFTHSLADRITCVSRRVDDFVVQQVGIPREKTIVIPNGIDLQDFDRLPTNRDARLALDLPLGEPLIGAVTRLNPVKRLDLLLQAVVSLSDVHTVIVGEGPERVRLEAMVDQLDLVGRVHFVGHQQDVRPWLAALDVFVLPSDWEGMSNALLEAMAAGLPVVATRVGGTPEVVVDGMTGLLVPLRDPDALAEAITRLLSDSDLRRTIGQAGRARVERHFSIEETVKKTEELYMTLLREKGY